jgi:ABC-type multidrug transport system fused ATPase/permease subunit
MTKEIDDLSDRNVGSMRAYVAQYRDSVKTFRWIWNELVNDKAKYWTKIFACIVLVQTIFEMLVPLPIRYLVDGVVAKNVAIVSWSLGAYALLHVIPRLINWCALAVRNHIGCENLSSLDRAMNTLFFGKSLGQHMHESSLLSSANMEKGRMRVIQIQEVVYNEAISTIFGLSSAFVLLWWTSIFAGVVATGLLMSVVLWSLYLNRQVIINCLPIDREYRAYARCRAERWEHVERVKVNGKEQEEIDHMHQQFSELLERERKFWRWYDSMKTLRGLINSMGVLSIVAYTVYQTLFGSWSVGILFPLIAWGGYVKDNLWRLGELEHQMNWNLPSIYALKQTLEVPSDIAPGELSISSEDGVTVELCDVSHAYPLRSDEEVNSQEEAEGRMVLKNVSFTIERGKKVALIGESGAGKTTSMRLLYRACDPTNGAILINGINLKDLDLIRWSSSIGYIAQSPQIFDGTIRYNLTYALTSEQRAAITDEELLSLLQKMRLTGSRFSQGLETVVGKRGVKLSGGEAQRLMIIAAAIKKPKFMIIDEATSSLDSTTEKEVQRGLEEVLGPDVSALIITHRLSTVRKICDQFVVLKSTNTVINGDDQVEAIGSSFEELYRISPTFQRLCEDQDIVC